MGVGFALVLLLAAPPVGNPELVAIATHGPRPAVCTPVPRTSGGSVWQRARSTAEAAYCADLARGYARLLLAPERALTAAEAAEKSWPGQAAPEVLAARALFAVGRSAEASDRFDRALRLDRHALDAPDALHDRAAAALLAERLDVARRAYRALVPRVGLLSDDARARRVMVEAAAAVMTEGPGALDESVSYLHEARRRARSPGQTALVQGLLALTLSRQGLLDQARGVAAEADEEALDAALAATPPAATPPAATPPAATPPAATASAAGRSASLPVLPRGDLYAMAAIVAEPSAPEEAADHWRSYLESVGEQGIWAEHARSRLAALKNRR